MRLSDRHVYFALALILLFAGLSRSQTIVTDPTELTLTANDNGSVPAQSIRITSSGAALAATVTATTYGTGNWLSVSPYNVTTPNYAQVSFNLVGAPAATYTGAITITAPGATNSPVTIPVVVHVGTTAGNGGLVITPASLNFIGQAGGVAPDAQTLTVTSSVQALSFTASAATTDNGSWLQVRSDPMTTPATVDVSVNTVGMSAGDYSGTLTFTPVPGTTVTIPVTLVLTSGAALSTTTSSLQFFYQRGTILPTWQSFDVIGSSGPASFSVVTSTENGISWLSATPLSGTTRQTITVSVSPSLLPVGVYKGKVGISGSSSANGVEIPVTLTISDHPLLTAGPSPAPFVFDSGGAAPGAQTVAIGSTSGSLAYTATATTTDGNQWLTVSPASGNTPQGLTVVATPGTLENGTYTGTVLVSSANAANSPLRIPVKMIVSSTSQLTTNVQSIVFNYQLNGQSQVYAQQLGVYSGDRSVDVNVGVSTSSCGTTWLKSYTSAFTTPQVITVAFDPSQFSVPVTCQGSVSLYTGDGTSPLVIPVSLVVSNSPLFNVKPLGLSFTAPFDGDPTTAQLITLSVTDGSATAFTVSPSTASGTNWLTITPASGNTPATLRVIAHPFGLSVGNYSANLVISSPALPTSQYVPVTFRVTPIETVTIAPTSLSFTQSAGGPAPSSRSISFQSASGAALPFAVAASSGNTPGWLSLTPTSGTTPGAITVTANGSSLVPGTYQGSISLTVPAAIGSPFTIPVSLTVVGGPTIQPSPASLSFSYRAGAAASDPQTLTVTTTPAGLAVTAVASASWFTVAPASGGSGNTFTVGVAAGQPTGTYSGNITLTAAGSAAITVPVTLNVLAAAPVSITQIANAASGVRSAISPGEIVTLQGTSMGPAQGVPYRLTPAGLLDTTLAETRVFFDEFPAPLLYVSATQINAIVPYEVASRATVQVTVEYQGVRSAAYTLQVAATAPGIFTATQNGRGQGAILNQDYSYNGSTAPAHAGSVIQVFGTGEGLLKQAVPTGSLIPGIDETAANVTATIGGIPAAVQYAGGAPGQVAGLFQVNLVVPQGVPAGNALVSITIGSATTQTGVTAAIQ